MTVKLCKYCEGPTDGGTERRTDGRTDGRTDSLTDGRTEGQTAGRTDGRTDERTDRPTDEYYGVAWSDAGCCELKRRSVRWYDAVQSVFVCEMIVC